MPREEAAGASFRDGGEEVALEFCRPARASGSGQPPLRVFECGGASSEHRWYHGLYFMVRPVLLHGKTERAFLFCRIPEKESFYHEKRTAKGL